MSSENKDHQTFKLTSAPNANQITREVTRVIANQITFAERKGVKCRALLGYTVGVGA